MKKIFFLLTIIMVCMTSCLKDDLEDVASSDACEITNVEFEHRWTVQEGDLQKLMTQAITVSRQIDNENNKVTLVLTVPNASGNFTSDIRNGVSLQNLTCMFTVSAAASVKPLNSAPALGKPGDYSAKTYIYRVTAASGNYIDWTIEITNFNK